MGWFDHRSSTDNPRLIIDTNRMMVSIPNKYHNKVLNLLNTTWHSSRHRFKVSEAQKLTGKLARLAEGANWVFHLLSHLYSSIARALSDNTSLLLKSSQDFKQIVLGLKTGAFVTPCADLARHTNFAMKRAARLVHHASYQYNINTTMRSEFGDRILSRKVASQFGHRLGNAHCTPNPTNAICYSHWW